MLEGGLGVDVEDFQTQMSVNILDRLPVVTTPHFEDPRMLSSIETLLVECLIVDRLLHTNRSVGVEPKRCVSG